MQKGILERFISKYYLSGAAPSVLWTTTPSSLGTRFISDDKTVLGVIKTTEAGFDDGEYGIFDTAQLSSLMGVLDTDVQVKVTKVNGKSVSLQIRDAATRATFMLAEKGVIPSVPDLKQLPTFDLEIALDTKFVTTFVKGKNSLSDVETFTILTADGNTQVVIGYSPNTNTNQIAFNVGLVKGTGLDRTINFNAARLKDILLANKEAKSGTLRVSSKGLAHVTFDIEGFEVAYYLVEKQG